MNVSLLSWIVASWNYCIILGIRVFPILELKSPMMNIFPSFESLSIASWHSSKNISLPSLDLFIFEAYIFMKWIFSVFILIVTRIIFFFTYSTSSIIFSNFWCISILTNYDSVLFLYSTIKKSVIFISGAFSSLVFRFEKCIDIYAVRIHFHDDFLIFIIPWYYIPVF